MVPAGKKNGKSGPDAKPHVPKANFSRRSAAVSKSEVSSSVRYTSGVPWRWILSWAALVSLLTYALGLLLVSAGIHFLSLLGKLGWVDPGREDYIGFGRVAGAVGWPVIYLTLTVGAAMWVGRRVMAAAPLNGVLIGLISTGVIQGVSLLFAPLVPRDFLVYLSLGLAGGFVGGRRGWEARAGEEALYETSRAVSAARSPREIVAAIGENLAGAEVSGITLWEHGPQNSGNGLSLVGSWSPKTEQQWPPGTQLDLTRIGITPEEGDGTPLELRTEELPGAGRETWEDSGARSLLLIPLVPPGRGSWGMLAISSRKKRGFSRRAARSYLTAAGPATLSAENVRLLGQTRRSARKAGMLGERQRLSREIHDTLAQGFTSIVMNLEAAEGALPEEAPGDALVPRTKWHLDQARLTARESLTEARRLVWALRPESLENASLPEALAQLAARWTDSAGVEASANLTGTPRPLSAEAEVTFVRVAQGALANVQKHARASRAVLTLSYMEDRVALDVIDDGTGFEADCSDPVCIPEGDLEGGFGLHTMRERVEQLGGRLTIESTPGEGTTLVADLPLIAADRPSKHLHEMP